MARATAHIGTEAYATQIETAGRTLIADEPEGNGGKNAGLAPYDLLLSSLSACTAITLRMYADRKQWPMESAEVALHFYRDDTGKEFIDRTLLLSGPLDKDQIARLLDVSERTPVTKTLKQGLTIKTSLA
ncbi:osmC-like family protein [Asticcacaulis biprosthecium C19]|uniref:OsmC-like family protein n=1 Tax=Asticcacaulis biprosthecium C19 TaxID=715226 RepID=F4QGI0_9CAUL|nr:OsmC family protein [Asticcacaulis biprosthecium]EGF93661.1 osmC-like family protein [Asticcacaulis biprosthecium C19]